jgi:glycogen operon protein
MITCHDGFTLRDLVSYREKHNLANREDNRDGHNHNLSDNCGVEGPTRDRRIRALRQRRERTFLATLLLARGVPMLSHGDEWGRSQGGNNNAYCQDNPTAWVAWGSPHRGPSSRRLAFLRRLAALRRRFAILRQGPFPARWRGPDGVELKPEDWQREESGGLSMQLEDLLLLFNPEEGAVTFRLPTAGRGRCWHLLLDSDNPLPRPLRPGRRRHRHSWDVAAGSLVLLRRRATGLQGRRRTKPQ